VHPFPSLLDATAAGALATIAGADLSVSVRLAGGMLALQFAIGSANDLADARPDALGHPTKPIPAGLVAPGAARAIFAAAVLAGLFLAATVGGAALAVAIAGLGVGLLYDLRLKGTALSWLPFAVGVGLLPVYSWLGATGSLRPAFLLIVPLALLAGSSLAAANALADLDADLRAGTASVAVFLGRRPAAAMCGLTLGLVQFVVLGSSAVSSPAPIWMLAEAAAVAAGWVGWTLNAMTGEAGSRLGWEIEAVSILVLGVCWLVILSLAGSL
jgi:4-hydroxybenzoate polyprenyltransferase